MKELFQCTKGYAYSCAGSGPYQLTFQEEGGAYPFAPNGLRMCYPHEPTLQEEKMTPKAASTRSSSPREGNVDRIETTSKNTPTESPMEASQGLENEKESGNSTTSILMIFFHTYERTSLDFI